MKAFAIGTVILAAAALNACAQDLSGDRASNAAQVAGDERARAAARTNASDVVARLDNNADGSISRAEYEAVTTAIFLKSDANGDGRLTGGERRMHHGKPGPEQTRDEFMTQSMSVFEGEDTDRNGAIAGDEVERFREHMERGARS